MTNGAARKGWYHGWNIVAIAVLAQVAANGIALNAFSLFLKDWAAEYHTSISTLQLAILPMIVVAAVISPIVGGMADRMPARWLVGIGLLGVALFALLMSMTTAVWQYLALYGTLLPFAVTFSTSVVVNALVSRWFVRRIGLALGITAFGVGLGGVVVPPIMAYALDPLGWRLLWRLAAAVIAIAIAPIALALLRDRPTERDGLHYLTADGGSQRPHGHVHGGGADSGLKVMDVLKRRNFWILVAVYLPILAVYSACMQNMAPIAASHGISRESAGFLLAVFSAAHVAATLLLGFVSDRFGNRLPFAGLAVVMAIGAVMVSFSHTLPQMTVAVVLVGFGGGEWTLLSAATAAEFDKGMGRAYGLFMACLPINSLIPFGIAKSQETTGSYTPGLLTLGVLALIGGGVGLLLRERRGDHASAGQEQALPVTPAASA